MEYVAWRYSGVKDVPPALEIHKWLANGHRMLDIACGMREAGKLRGFGVPGGAIRRLFVSDTKAIRPETLKPLNQSTLSSVRHPSLLHTESV